MNIIFDIKTKKKLNEKGWKKKSKIKKDHLKEKKL